jgi:hypothetical protein
MMGKGFSYTRKELHFSISVEVSNQFRHIRYAWLFFLFLFVAASHFQLKRITVCLYSCCCHLLPHSCVLVGLQKHCNTNRLFQPLFVRAVFTGKLSYKLIIYVTFSSIIDPLRPILELKCTALLFLGATFERLHTESISEWH